MNGVWCTVQSYLARCAGVFVASCMAACGARSSLEPLSLGEEGTADSGPTNAPDARGPDAEGPEDTGAEEATDMLGNGESEPSCKNPCTLGDSRCDAEGISTCVLGANGCTAWGEPVPCGANGGCQKSTTQATCVCNPGYTLDGGACSLFVASIPAPRPIAPLSTATVTSQSPVLKWALASGDDGVLVDLCGDRACTTSIVSFQASGTSGAPPTALAAGVHYWRLHGVANGVVGRATGPVWEFFVGSRSAPVNTSWGTTLDVNGDGFADVLVGASSQAGGYLGAAYVYLGGAGGLSPTPSSLTDLAGGSGGFGFSVASAGDVNGDGFGDAIVGADGVNAAYVYLGSPGGLSTTPITLASPIGEEGEGFGCSVASAGDVNGDGFADVIIGAFAQGDAYTGAAYLYLGSPDGFSTPPIALISPSGPGGFFGASVASTGDVNGDGFADVVVGAVGANDNDGAAYLYLGGTGGLSLTPSSLTGPAGGSGGFGVSVASAGDVNGDGFADLIVGAESGSGAAYVFLGSLAGLSTTPTALIDPTSIDGGINSSFGYSLASAGDVNGDGFGDVIVGAPGENEDLGAAYVYFGSLDGLSTIPAALTDPAGSIDSGFGGSLASAGDVNGDGFSDVILGASRVAYVYPGGMGGPATTPSSLTDPGDEPYDGFGFSVASAGGEQETQTGTDGFSWAVGPLARLALR